jgi:hypothetical protein
VKVVHLLLSWLVLLLITATAFLVWITIYFRFVLHSMLTNANWQTALQDSRLSAPDVAYFPDFLYRAGLLALFCVAGRLVFGLRLNLVLRRTKP